jgi:hypothetical protein
VKITPLTTYTPKAHALLMPAGSRQLTVETEWGSKNYEGRRAIENILTKLKPFTCYTPSSLSQLRHTTGATQWVLSTWRGRDIKMTHTPSGTVVTSLQSTLIDAESPFAALTECLHWLADFAISPSSISSMAWKLLRASMGESIQIGFDPVISEAAFFGSRQEIWQPDRYRDCVAIDIKAAYPTAMASRPIALSLRKVSNDTTIDPEVSGLARCEVYVPLSLAHAPLPVRVSDNAIQFQYHRLSGVWPWVEVHAAQKLGCTVQITECYAPRKTFDLFGPWWLMAQSGRDLSPSAAQLAKAIANSAWGQFAMRGNDRGEVAWADDKGDQPFSTAVPGRNMPHAWTLHVAAEVTARVRTQLLMEGLYAARSLVIHADTDGLIVQNDLRPLPNSGNNFGQWRVKNVMHQVDLRAPQMYRYSEAGTPDIWHYVAAGMSHPQAVMAFNRHPDTYTRIAFLTGDVVLPSGRSEDHDGTAALLAQSRMLVA